VIEALWRLSWALPLVAVVGISAIFVVRRFVGVGVAGAAAKPRLALAETLRATEDTAIHVLEFERRTFLLVESVRPVTLLEVAPPTQTGSVTRSNWRSKFTDGTVDAR